MAYIDYYKVLEVSKNASEKDIKKAYRDYNFKDLKKKLFFREYFVESIDFKCLYKGLRQNKIDKERFPCLKTCSDTFSMHQFKIK